MRQTKSRNLSFTLVEVIMVITIIAILAVIALPKFINMRRDAQNAAAWGNIMALRSAATIYYAKTSVSRFNCLCLAASAPGSCNAYGRNISYGPPCFPANIEELEAQLNEPVVWPIGLGLKDCYNSSTGVTDLCF